MNPATRSIPTNKWQLGLPQKSNATRISGETIGEFKKGCLSSDCSVDDCSCFVTGEEQNMMGFMFSNRSSIDLLQNCDLPPPVKVFSGEIQRVSKADYAIKPSSPKKINQIEAQLGKDFCDDKLGLLKALQLSETRSREAEKRASDVRTEKNKLMGLFLKESSRLFAQKQWLKLLEMETLKLQSQLCVLQNEKQLEKKHDGRDEGSTLWTMALCFGIASVGFALGCRYLF